MDNPKIISPVRRNAGQNRSHEFLAKWGYPLWGVCTAISNESLGGVAHAVHDHAHQLIAGAGIIWGLNSAQAVILGSIKRTRNMSIYTSSLLLGTGAGAYIAGGVMLNDWRYWATGLLYIASAAAKLKKEPANDLPELGTPEIQQLSATQKLKYRWERVKPMKLTVGLRGPGLLLSSLAIAHDPKLPLAAKAFVLTLMWAGNGLLYMSEGIKQQQAASAKPGFTVS